MEHEHNGEVRINHTPARLASRESVYLDRLAGEEPELKRVEKEREFDNQERE